MKKRIIPGQCQFCGCTDDLACDPPSCWVSDFLGEPEPEPAAPAKRKKGKRGKKAGAGAEE